MSKTLNELVREQILAEGPEITVGHFAREAFVDHQLRYMPHSELLERISDALDAKLASAVGSLSLSDLSVRLGI